MKISDLGVPMFEGTIFRAISEVHDVGSRKDKDTMEVIQEPNGDVYDICRMCHGRQGDNPFSRGGVHRNDGAVSSHSGSMGGACGTCKGNWKRFLWNSNEMDNITKADTVAELQEISPDFYDTIKKANSQKLNAILAGLDSGTRIPQSLVDMYMAKKKKEAEPKQDIIKPVKPDDRRVRQTDFNKKFINR